MEWRSVQKKERKKEKKRWQATTAPSQRASHFRARNSGETVQQFRYLGGIISDEGSKPEILTRAAQTMTALGKLKSIWRDKNITLKYKVRLLRALFFSILLYAYETWPLTSELQRRIQRLEMRCYRNILGITYKDRVNEWKGAKYDQTPHRPSWRPHNSEKQETHIVRSRHKILWPHKGQSPRNCGGEEKERRTEETMDRQCRGMDREQLRGREREAERGNDGQTVQRNGHRNH